MSHPNPALAERVPEAIVDRPGEAEPHAAASTPPQYAQDSARRHPGTVIAAAVLAFVAGGVWTTISLFYVALLALFLSADKYSKGAALFGILLAVAVAFSALYIWGGVRVLKSRATMLIVVSLIQLSFTLLALVTLVHNLATAATYPSAALVRLFLGLVFDGTILILLAQRSSRVFFRARRAGTA